MNTRQGGRSLQFRRFEKKPIWVVSHMFVFIVEDVSTVPPGRAGYLRALFLLFVVCWMLCLLFLFLLVLRVVKVHKWRGFLRQTPVALANLEGVVLK